MGLAKTISDLVRTNGKRHWAITILLALIAAGGVGHMVGLYEFKWQKQLEKEKLKDERKQQQWQRDDNYLQLFRQEMTAHAKTRKELLDLKADLSILNGNIIDIPFPFWIKNLESKIIYVNHPYEEQILKPLNLIKFDIIGTLGEKMVSPETLQDYISNDQLVLRTGIMQMVEERAGSEIIGYSWKWAKYKNGRPVLLLGMFMSKDQLNVDQK